MEKQGHSSDGGRLTKDLFERVLSDSPRDFVHMTRLKEEQKRCLRSLAERKDVFGIVPTQFPFKAGSLQRLVSCSKGVENECKRRTACRAHGIQFRLTLENLLLARLEIPRFLRLEPK